PAVIDMSMAQYDRIDLFRVEWKSAIPLDRLAAPPLKQTAFQKQTMPIDFQHVQRAGGGPGGAKKAGAHARSMGVKILKSSAELEGGSEPKNRLDNTLKNSIRFGHKYDEKRFNGGVARSDSHQCVGLNWLLLGLYLGGEGTPQSPGAGCACSEQTRAY